MGGHDEPGAGDEAAVDRVAQVDRRELRIHAAEVAQRREAMAQVLVREREPGERLGRRRPQRLHRERAGVHGQVDVGVDEPGADRPVGQVDDHGVRAAHRRAHLGDDPVVHPHLGVAGQLTRHTIEDGTAHDDRVSHGSQSALLAGSAQSAHLAGGGRRGMPLTGSAAYPFGSLVAQPRSGERCGSQAAGRPMRTRHTSGPSSR